MSSSAARAVRSECDVGGKAFDDDRDRGVRVRRPGSTAFERFGTLERDTLGTFTALAMTVRPAGGRAIGYVAVAVNVHANDHEHDDEESFVTQMLQASGPPS